ncbi:MAG: hypothetical protein KDK11_14010, partial [Maritimibacter sp.]|nr:hypothetical protein [Maritimibacter sp.]
APQPALVMPDIGPDPEDDTAPQDVPLLDAALRRRRPASPDVPHRTGLNPTLLQAYADRLQTLSGRLGATPEGRRPF